ncbi:hypothetical protein RhiirA5_407576 [Rhizophagus irregularis]|uniref:Uncharacterized protein n=1 Tax=Rhizophagus irregularis TaxID=588596 RepID=A0A2I1ET99_9GLOM|nr:hypothetical protein RhiirA5_407576 [Rhizophagus irregularis]PKC72989.1 hypothetical protein RhiirA1_451696 [Rhizophagus irregularis]PKY25347.1 hypothetical protein RhiirB3_440253 [Rhizophagus irregularis]
MSLYGETIARGNLVSILQSIGAAGLGTLGNFLSSSFGAAIGAIGGSNLAVFIEMNKDSLTIIRDQINDLS